MFEKIVDILSEHTEYDKSKMNRDTSLLMDLGLNSLEVVKIVMELEEEFEIEFSEEDLPRITTLGELEDLIKEMTEE
ncbi:MAG: acyl carrier protein [Butyrivibrio sp.]|nr:acyl carrier protein [Butyrivibrio sp.]